MASFVRTAYPYSPGLLTDAELKVAFNLSADDATITAHYLGAHLPVTLRPVITRKMVFWVPTY